MNQQGPQFQLKIVSYKVTYILAGLRISIFGWTILRFDSLQSFTIKNTYFFSNVCSYIVLNGAVFDGHPSYRHFSELKVLASWTPSHW